MNILALDPATHCGFAHSNGARGVWWLGSAGADAGSRVVRFEDELYAAIEKWPIELIAFECLHYGSKGHQAAAVRASLLGVLELVAKKNTIRLRPCPISTIKLFATGHGHAKKPDMIRAAAIKLGIATLSDDEADALWILEYAKAGFPQLTATKAKRPKRRGVKPKAEARLF